MDGGLATSQEGGAREQPERGSCCEAGQGAHVLLRGEAGVGNVFMQERAQQDISLSQHTSLQGMLLISSGPLGTVRAQT